MTAVAVTVDPLSPQRLQAHALELLERDTWSRERLLEHRRDRLRALIRHATTSSPYYREALGGDAEHAELEDLPTLSKSTLMEEFDRVELSRTARLHTSWLYRLTKKINTEPSLYLKAGAIHGCVLCREDKALVYMEDVGRHNAVDKLVGAVARERELPLAGTVLVVSARASFEIAQKASVAGIPALVAVGAPTSLAVHLAREVGMTLVAFTRDRHFSVYSRPDRVPG